MDQCEIRLIELNGDALRREPLEVRKGRPGWCHASSQLRSMARVPCRRLTFASGHRRIIAPWCSGLFLRSPEKSWPTC